MDISNKESDARFTPCPKNSQVLDTSFHFRRLFLITKTGTDRVTGTLASHTRGPHARLGRNPSLHGDRYQRGQFKKLANEQCHTAGRARNRARLARLRQLGRGAQPARGRGRLGCVRAAAGGTLTGVRRVIIIGTGARRASAAATLAMIMRPPEHSGPPGSGPDTARLSPWQGPGDSARAAARIPYQNPDENVA